MIIYTDGSCRGNGKENSSGGFGVVVVDNGKIIDAYSEFKDNTTNNEQEMLAILYAYKKYGINSKEDKTFPPKEPVTVFSDSSYSVNTFNNWMFNWANNNWIKSDKSIPKNLDLVKEYYNHYSQGYRINLQYVKGHKGIAGNEMADKLATGVIKPKDIIMEDING